MFTNNIIRNLFARRKRIERQTGQLFFLGNKRSGTTILAEKINLHPDIYITHETDIIWILYNLYNGIKFEYCKYDEPHSTIVTLEKCKHILDEYQSMTPLECYEKCQYHLMRNGTQWIKPTDKVPLILGDKKPNQQSGKLIINWVAKHFFYTKYLHIVRHPFDFLSSIPRLLPKYDYGARYGSPKCKDPVKVLETWAYFEEVVVMEKEKNQAQIHSVRFEDLCDHPALELSKVWNFLDLPIPPELKDKIEKNDSFDILSEGLHGDSRGNKFSLQVPDKVKNIMDFYDYKIS